MPLVRLHADAELAPDPNAPGEAFVAPFTGNDSRFVAGVWSAEESEAPFDDYPNDEMCVVISGMIAITIDGVRHEFGPGEAFAVSKGTSLTWYQSAGTRKFFALLD
jgi:uncharacterized cupin superfamily protein